MIALANIILNAEAVVIAIALCVGVGAWLLKPALRMVAEVLWLLVRLRDRRLAKRHARSEADLRKVRWF